MGHKENGESIFRYIYADTQKELTAKLHQNIDAYRGVELTEQSRMSLSKWLDKWLDERMVGTIRSHTLEGYRRDIPPVHTDASRPSAPYHNTSVALLVT